jgi:hypothetical protein
MRGRPMIGYDAVKTKVKKDMFGAFLKTSYLYGRFTKQIGGLINLFSFKIVQLREWE